MLRGGSWLNAADFVRAANRLSVLPDFEGGEVGFRCARDYAPGDTVAPSPAPTPTATPAPLGFTPVTYNDQWTPVFREFGGMEMALVPAGCFHMGDLSGAEQPGDGGRQCFDEPFWIGRYEVTQAQYHGCVRGWCGADLPRTGVSWFSADNFCREQGLRLLTEAEWEYAARGPDNLWYTWGNRFVPDYVVYGVNDIVGLQPVASHAGDLS